MGVDPPGVSIGVVIPGVPCGVAAPRLGVILGVAEPKAGVEFEGVSSHRDRRLLADPGSDSMMESAPIRSARGVSAHPLLCPGVSEENNRLQSSPIRSPECLYYLFQFSVSRPSGFFASTFHVPASLYGPESLRDVLGLRPKCEHSVRVLRLVSHFPCGRESRPIGDRREFSTKRLILNSVKN